MKKVYKLQNEYFNIEFIKKMSELEIINNKAVQDSIKKSVEEADKRFENIFDRCNYPTIIQPIEIIHNYTEECRTARIKIDDKEYFCDNYISNSEIITVNYTVSKEKQKEYNKFVKEAKELLSAFKKLEIEE